MITPGKIAALVLTGAILCACNIQGITDMQTFTGDDTVRLELDGVRCFIYKPGTCQLAYNEKRCEFRAHSDTMLDYFILTLERLPAFKGQKVTGTIIWSTNRGERTKNNITLSVRRIKGDTIWLCDESSRNAVVVRVLE